MREAETIDLRTLPAEIRLRGVSVPVRIGVKEEERVEPRAMSFDLSLTVDLAADAEGRIADRIETTLDYGALHRLIVDICAEREYKLIETLAVEIRRRIEREFPRARGLRIRCSKPAPPLKGEVAAAEVVLPPEGAPPD